MENMEDSYDDFFMFPLTDIENNNELPKSLSVPMLHDDHSSSSDEEADPLMVLKPTMTLRQRRHSQLLGQPLQNLNLQMPKSQPKPIYEDSPNKNIPRWKYNWRKAVRKIRSMKDPWEKFHIEKLPTETAVRHRYNALKKKWVVDHIKVKMENNVSLILNITF